MPTTTENPPTPKRPTEPKADELPTGSYFDKKQRAPELRIEYRTNLCSVPQVLDAWYTEDGAVKGPNQVIAISTLSPVFSGSPAAMTGTGVHQRQIQAFMKAETFFLLALPALGAQSEAMLPASRVFFDESEAAHHLRRTREAGAGPS